eukprot:COSAG01_NODE_6720_length_3524_cov_197.457859_4_plen_98_part_00
MYNHTVQRQVIAVCQCYARSVSLFGRWTLCIVDLCSSVYCCAAHGYGSVLCLGRPGTVVRTCNRSAVRCAYELVAAAAACLLNFNSQPARAYPMDRN